MALNRKGDKNIQAKLDAAMPQGFKASLGVSPDMQIAREKAGDAMTRTASAMMGMGGGGVAGVARGPLMYTDPLFDPILFLFPKDRIDEINKRLRHYYETDPIVGGAIDMHTAFPLSDFYLECENKENEKFWNDWKDRVGLMEALRCLVHDHWLCGEGVMLPIWDDFNFEISHFNQYPPENVDIVQTYVTPKKFFMLKPDAKLREKANSANELDQNIVKMMDPKYVETLKDGKPFFLGSDDKVMYLARLSTKYRSRGISLVSRALKDLLYKDKLRLLQLTFVDRHMFPIKIFKLGSESRGWIPNKKHFDRLQALLAQAQNDPDFNILYHFGLQVDYVGTKDKVANLVPEYEWVEKQVMAALFVNEEIIHGGMPSAVRDTVNMRTLMYRYLDVREKIERMMITHIFLPMARARGFYRKTAINNAKKLERKAMKSASGKVRDVEGNNIEGTDLFRVANSVSGNLDLSAYDIPRPIWKKINLVNNAAEQQVILGLEDSGKLPVESVYDMLGMDPRIIKSKLEAQDGTIFDPLRRQIREEIGKTGKIRKQVLRGEKTKDWDLDSVDDEVAPDMGGKPPAPGKKPPAAPGGAAPAGMPEKPKEKPKAPPPPPGGGAAPIPAKPPAAPPPKPSTPPIAPGPAGAPPPPAPAGGGLGT